MAAKSSLVGDIFGGGSKKGTSETADSSLSNLFEESTSLPAKPQHKVQPRRVSSKVTESNEEVAETTTKKKRKQRKPKPSPDDAKRAGSGGDDTALPGDDDEATAEGRTIFVGNLPLSTTRKALASLFKACGKIESTRLRSVAATGVKLPPKHAGDQDLVKKVCANTGKLDTNIKSSAQGYVVFCEKASVEKALELNNTVHPGASEHRLRVDRASPVHDASRSVFVGNLPYHAEEASLQACFVSKCGLKSSDVEAIRIIRDKETMKCKGFGYVLFADKGMVATALQKVHGRVYLKRELRVTVCGKRFKGRRGDDSAVPNKKQKRSFEGNRASAVVAPGAMKRILGKPSSKHAGDTTGLPLKKDKKRRARGDTKRSSDVAKKGVKKAGVSRRAAAEAKLGKRIKKIQKRVSKGMGKARK